MSIVDQKWSAPPVPHAMDVPDRAPEARSFERAFGLPYEKLLPALHSIDVNRLERPVVDLGF